MGVPMWRRASNRRLVSCGLVLGGVLLASTSVRVQGPALPPALAERFGGGVAALQSGALDEAEAAFRGVIAAGRAPAFVHHNLGIVLQRRERHAEAVTEFRRAARLDPAFGPPRLLAGASLIALGRPSEAVPELEAAVGLMPKEIAAHLQLADACERTGRIARMTAAYRAIVALDPDNPEYAYRLGKAYLRLSQQAYERISAVDPRSPRLSQALGRAYLSQGQPQRAQLAFEAALERDPSLPDVQLALARLHADARRWDEAARYVAQALALVPESREARALQASIEAARSGAPR